jgi:hypothetical protein
MVRRRVASDGDPNLMSRDRMSAVPLLETLAIDAQSRVGGGAQAVVADRLVALVTTPITSVLELAQSPIDLSNRGSGVLFQGEIYLSVQSDRGRLGHVLIVRTFFGRVLQRLRKVRVEVDDLTLQSFALVKNPLSQRVAVHQVTLPS